MRAILSSDQQSFILRGERWIASFPIADLGKQLRFYRLLRDRSAPKDKAGKATGPGPYAAHYISTITALERVERMISPR